MSTPNVCKLAVQYREQRAMIKTISQQRWNGAADAGKWPQTTTLNIPTATKKLVRMMA